MALRHRLARDHPCPQRAVDLAPHVDNLDGAVCALLVYRDSPAVASIGEGASEVLQLWGDAGGWAGEDVTRVTLKDLVLALAVVVGVLLAAVLRRVMGQ